MNLHKQLQQMLGNIREDENFLRHRQENEDNGNLAGFRAKITHVPVEDRKLLILTVLKNTECKGCAGVMVMDIVDNPDTYGITVSDDFVVTMMKTISGEDMDKVAELAKKLGPLVSKLLKSGKLPKKGLLALTPAEIEKAIETGELPEGALVSEDEDEDDNTILGKRFDPFHENESKD